MTLLLCTLSLTACDLRTPHAAPAIAIRTSHTRTRDTRSHAHAHLSSCQSPPRSEAEAHNGSTRRHPWWFCSVAKRAKSVGEAPKARSSAQPAPTAPVVSRASLGEPHPPPSPSQPTAPPNARATKPAAQPPSRPTPEQSAARPRTECRVQCVSAPRPIPPLGISPNTSAASAPPLLSGPLCTRPPPLGGGYAHGPRAPVHTTESVVRRARS